MGVEAVLWAVEIKSQVPVVKAMLRTFRIPPLLTVRFCRVLLSIKCIHSANTEHLL